ncbi:MAG: GFA family protein [Maritimibacter sp.]
MSEHHGHCLCGAVQFTATQLGSFGVCHCRMCQRWSGSAHFGVTVDPAHMQVTAGEDQISRYRSSPVASRYFCSNCGSGLWSRYDHGSDEPGDYELNVGLLDDPNGLTLRREIFYDRKPDSYALAGDHERLSEADTALLFGISTEGVSP